MAKVSKYLTEGEVSTKKFADEIDRTMKLMKELEKTIIDRSWVSQKGVDRFTKEVSMIRSKVDELLNLISKHTA